uniref:DNA polymerase n=1 Tax=Termitomyces sp. T123 TaxID=2846913 RepID=A0A8H2S9T9_9AGAR|nr:DNA polymerase [Termitomyces sp. T123]
MKLIRIFLRFLINLRKRIFATNFPTIFPTIFYKLKELGDILINSIKNRLINIISYTFLGIIIFFFIGDIKILDMIQIFIFSIFSFAISMFILDNFKFSNIKFINFLQRFVIMNCFLILIGLILYLFDISILPTILCEGESDSLAENSESENNNEDKNNKDVLRVSTTTENKDEEYYNFKIKKDLVDKIVNNSKDLGKTAITEIAPNLGVGSATGAAAAAAIKYTSGMSAGPRVALVGGIALATASGMTVGIELGKAAVRNHITADEIDAPESSEGRTSPSNIDGGFIHSVLDENEIPLIIMVNGLCYFNYIEFTLILSLFSLLIRKYLIIPWLRAAFGPGGKLKRFIFYLKKKKIKNKEVESINDENVSLSLNKALNIGDKSLDYLMVFIFICLILIKFINIYYSLELAENIDSYIKVYNHMHNKSMLLLLSINTYVPLKNPLGLRAKAGEYIVWPRLGKVVPRAKNKLLSPPNSTGPVGNPPPTPNSCGPLGKKKNININIKYPLSILKIYSLKKSLPLKSHSFMRPFVRDKTYKPLAFKFQAFKLLLCPWTESRAMVKFQFFTFNLSLFYFQPLLLLLLSCRTDGGKAGRVRGLFTIIIWVGIMAVVAFVVVASSQITSDFILFPAEVSCCSSVLLAVPPKFLIASQNTSNSEIKHKYQLIKVTVPFNELSEIKFIKLLMLNLKLNSLNTILFQYNEYSTFTNLMLGPQVGIVVKETHDIAYYRRLFEHYIEKLEILMSLYMVDTPDFIVIHLKELLVDDSIKIGQMSKIELPKRLITVSETKTKFNNKMLPLTLDEKHFGNLLQDSIKAEYLNKIINYLQNNILLLNNSADNKSNLSTSPSASPLWGNGGPAENRGNIKEDLDLNNIAVQLKNERLQIAFLKEVLESNRFKVYLSKNKLYLIISYLTNKFDYNRIVFHNKTGKLLFCSKDSFNNENLAFLQTDTRKHFVRECGNLSVALNKDYDIELLIKQINLPPIKYTEHNKFINPESNLSRSKQSKPIPTRNPKFGVFDIETFIDKSSDGVSYSRVYALGFCTCMGDPSLYYLIDYFDNTLESSNKLVIKCIDDMLIPEFNNYIFYAHNFGRFDAIFLHKILLDYNLSAETENQYKIVPLYRDNKMIRLEVLKTINSNIIKITFVDSYNILNNSLEKLCNDFSVTTKKGIFPYLFVNKDNLEYIGPTPDISFYNSNVNVELYNKNKVSNWSLKTETLKYLKRDLLSLLEILEKFQEFLWLDHNIELTEGLTIASLAKTKFMRYYLKDSKIPLINSNNLFQFIYGSYYGGITEVYRPHGKNLTYTDINSLYPFAALNPMPGLNCKWLESYNSEGLELSNLFGVFYAKVVTNDQYLGLLPVRTKSGLIFPQGKFDGIWTTVELEMAKAHGYQITVIKGLHFNKVDSPFKEYVEELSTQKDILQGSPRQIVKSLLNNLIGRFALNFVKPITKTVTKTELDYLLATKEIKTFKEINENNYLITYIPIVNKEICESHNLDYHKVILNEKNSRATSNLAAFLDVSIVVASFVTAYARIYMHNIKLAILKVGGKIYYSDTDSIVTDLTLERLNEELPDKIGNKLGQLKLEYLVEEAYFISNKTYFLFTYDGQEIKKAKGISPESLSKSDFEAMYLKSQSVQGKKTSSNISYNKGSVLLQTKEITIDWNSFKKREKIFESNLWLDTRPLYIDTLTKSITKYKPFYLIPKYS